MQNIKLNLKQALWTAVFLSFLLSHSIFANTESTQPTKVNGEEVYPNNSPLKTELPTDRPIEQKQDSTPQPVEKTAELKVETGQMENHTAESTQQEKPSETEKKEIEHNKLTTTDNEPIATKNYNGIATFFIVFFALLILIFTLT